VTAHAGGPLLPAPVLEAIVGAARAHGLPVAAHAEGPGTVAAAVSAGVDLLAHTPWTAAEDDGLLRSAADQGMRWISTLDIHGWGSETPAVGTAIDNLRRFLGYGGSVLYGTDLGNGPLVPGVNPREIRLLQRAGLTPAEILAAMTPDAAVLPPCWIPGGLDLSPSGFADVMATARVVGPEVRPRV
jgi:imidazolonepropionase-like amidohydrolase